GPAKPRPPGIMPGPIMPGPLKPGPYIPGPPPSGPRNRPPGNSPPGRPPNPKLCPIPGPTPVVEGAYPNSLSPGLFASSTEATGCWISFSNGGVLIANGISGCVASDPHSRPTKGGNGSVNGISANRLSITSGDAPPAQKFCAATIKSSYAFLVTACVGFFV